MSLTEIPTKPTLFHAQWWSSSKVAYILKALGVTGKDGPIDIVKITGKEVKGDPILTKLNPQKRLPFFYDPQNDLKLHESGAMLEYFLELYDTDHKFWVAPGDPLRAEYLKLLHFGAATGYHISVPILFRYMPKHPGAEMTPAKVAEEKVKEWHEIVATTYEQALEKHGGPFLLGQKWTAVDVVAGYDLMTLGFAEECGKEMMEAHPKIKEYFAKLGECPIHKELYSYTPPPEEETKDDTEPKIIETETKRFWAKMGKGPFDGAGAAFGKLGGIQKECFPNKDEHKIHTAMLVLCDVPNTKKEDLVWAAAMLIPKTVPETKAPPEGLEEIIVKGRQCATTMHKGDYAALPKSWGNLCMKWIPSQKLQPCKGSRECPHYEVYLNSGDKKKDAMVTQLFSPVEPADGSNNKHQLDCAKEPHAKKAKAQQALLEKS